MGITLDTIDYAFHSIQIKDAAGDTLAIAADGSISVTDNGGSLTVDATNLDIRDLTHVSDSVKVGDGTDFLAIDASCFITANINGTVAVSATNLDIRDLTHVSDSVKVGDGTDFLAVNADGSINVLSSPDAYDVWKATNATVTNTAGQLLGTPLTGRLNLIVQNLGSQDVYLGQTNGVTTTTGLKLPKGSSLEMAFGAGAGIYAITASGSSDVRLAEFAS
jgi:hypothetical protein